MDYAQTGLEYDQPRNGSVNLFFQKMMGSEDGTMDLDWAGVIVEAGISQATRFSNIGVQFYYTHVLVGVGARISAYTDFNRTVACFRPQIGFYPYSFHVSVGYNFLIGSEWSDRSVQASRLTRFSATVGLPFRTLAFKPSSPDPWR